MALTAALATTAALSPHIAHGADHSDSPAAVADPLADLNDVFAWMNEDASRINLALTVGGQLPPTSFGTSVSYVFHLGQTATFGEAGTQSELRCTFADEETFECWLVDMQTDAVLAYVNGDVDDEAGASADGMRIFAGERSDSFFFELDGFTNAVDAARMAAPSLPPEAFDDDGCILLEGSAFDNEVGTTSPNNDIVQLLTSSPARGADPLDPDNRAPANSSYPALPSLAIVVQLDMATLPGTPGDLLSVWASTHREVL